MVTIYKAIEWHSHGDSEKFTCVTRTWADQDLCIFVKQFCLKEKAN